MVTYYNRKDLQAFGNYLLSYERKTRQHKNVLDGTVKDEVTQADIENWKDGMSKTGKHKPSNEH